MSPEEFREFQVVLSTQTQETLEQISDLPFASAIELDDKYNESRLAEAIFLEAFTAYEVNLETLFLHYACGGLSLNGIGASRYLSVNDEARVRAIAKAGQRFLSWAKPSQTRETAQLYLENGWPIAELMSTKEQVLSDCEKVRNRIAHNSIEANTAFKAVQRNIFGTERAFNLRPGQLLRIKMPRTRFSVAYSYIVAMGEVTDALINPPV